IPSITKFSFDNTPLTKQQLKEMKNIEIKPLIHDLSTYYPKTVEKKQFQPSQPNKSVNVTSASNLYNKNNKNINTKPSIYPVLTKPNYKTIPSYDTILNMSEKELSNVENFTIIHNEYGEIIFPNKTDIRYLNLDEIITFTDGSVNLYPH